jgi:hypothetical protein
MMLIIVRAVQTTPRLAWIVALACLFNASVALGPATKNPLAGFVYHKFYQHAPSPQMIRNLDLYGRRPLGICSANKLKKKRRPASAPAVLSSAEALSRGG